MKKNNRSDVSYWNEVAFLSIKGVETYPPLSNSLFSARGSPFIGLDFFRLCQKNRVMELGCGNGNILLSIVNQVDHGIGIDFSPMQIHIAKEAAHKITNLDFFVHDLNHGLPQQFPWVDYYYSIYGAFDFIKSPFQLLTECWELLPGGGRIVILTSFLPLIDMIKNLNKCNLESFISGSGKHCAIRIQKGSSA